MNSIGFIIVVTLGLAVAAQALPSFGLNDIVSHSKELLSEPTHGDRQRRDSDVINIISAYCPMILSSPYNKSDHAECNRSCIYQLRGYRYGYCVGGSCHCVLDFEIMRAQNALYLLRGSNDNYNHRCYC